MVISALMGAGPLADAYFVALRLPNQFRAIFGEGAFTSAYVPTYSRVLVAEGDARATLFASLILTPIPFPYLSSSTIATLHTGTLNAHGYFAAGAFAPVLLNLFVMGFLA